MPSDVLEFAPDKRYFKIGEVSAITGLKSFVLRFWETEFPEIRPTRTLSGQRIYKKSDLERILLIKHLLYDQKFTIPGAREYLKNSADQKAGDTGKASSIALKEIITELSEIRALLD